MTTQQEIEQRKTSVIVYEERVGAHTVTLERRLEVDGYDNLYQVFEACIDGKRVFKSVTSNTNDKIITRQAHDDYKWAKILAKSC